MKISPAVKVGILTIIAVILLIFSLMWLKGRSMSSGERIDINFNDVDGMRPGSAVQMMGIRIGQIEEIVPVIEKDKSYVKVKLVITEPNIIVPQASTISIQQSGIIGEKFIEITPPQIQSLYIPVTKSINGLIEAESPVEIPADGKYVTIGRIKYSEMIDTKTLSKIDQQEINTPYAYKIGYVVTMPNVTVPADSIAKIIPFGNNNEKKYKLRLIPPGDMIVQIPETDSKYTIVEPMRLKEFMDLQLESAAALKETNDKINLLLSDESISDLKQTLKNTKNLTAKATITLDQANKLLVSSKGDFEELMNLATELSGKMLLLTDNVNNIVGEPEFKKNLLATAKSLQQFTDEISDILSDPELKETFKYVNSSAKDLSEITNNLKVISSNKNFQGELTYTINNLNESLDKINVTLDNVNCLTKTQEGKIKDIVDDSTEITENMKKFSEKLNKRFLLFRLLF